MKTPALRSLGKKIVVDQIQTSVKDYMFLGIADIKAPIISTMTSSITLTA